MGCLKLEAQESVENSLSEFGYVQERSTGPSIERVVKKGISRRVIRYLREGSVT